MIHKICELTAVGIYRGAYDIFEATGGDMRIIQFQDETFKNLFWLRYSWKKMIPKLQEDLTFIKI